ncbi:MAG: hypothetical protein Q7V20_08650, partial [Aquabacterium sp.]|uniref:hypothetical protein n=1 Tax=Aquabacterium sp. TaxID=1872578 RepID=UPI0027270785
EARDEAGALFAKLATDPAETTVALRMQAVAAAIANFTKNQRWEAGRSLLAAVRSSSLSATALDAYGARIELEAGDREMAIELASRARDSIESATDHADVRLTALMLADLGMDRDALPLWQRLAAPKHMGFDTRQLVNCTLRLREHGVFLGICEELRSSGVHDRQLVLMEAGVRVDYDIEGAIKLLRDYLELGEFSAMMREVA